MAQLGRPEPSRSPIRRVEALARAVMPLVLAVLSMAVASGPTGIPGLVAAVALPQVVYWSVARPAAMPPPAVFALGLLLDLLTLAPLGSGVLALLVVHGLAVAGRRWLARQGFLVNWLAFAGFAIGAAGFFWALTALLLFTLPPVAPALHQAALTAGLYPAFAFLLGRLHAMMLRAEEDA
jgi:rod shape-determining protein MreD